MSIFTRPEEPARGPRPSFSRARLTEAAIGVADAEGLKAISMRRVAAEIGAGTMSLYRYVSSKDDLIELMLDAVSAEYVPDGVEPTGDWRADLRAFAERGRQVVLRHPWMAPLVAARQTAGPNRILMMERALRLLEPLGSSTDGLLTVIGSVWAYVGGFVATELAEREAFRASGMELMEFMTAQGAYIQSVLDGGDYPMWRRMLAEGGRNYVDPEARFSYGLERLLDGIEARPPS
ncbi:MAG: TetR/AcrR family transcriptional regulator [Nonomuraea sp.]|nr:TetR/AcrR family transcriptional regulator [Nonomuraea sp.]